jgi:hypothetical protein
LKRGGACRIFNVFSPAEFEAFKKIVFEAMISLEVADMLDYGQPGRYVANE